MLLEIKELKQKLYKELDAKEILEISGELDKLIMEFYSLEIKPQNNDNKRKR